GATPGLSKSRARRPTPSCSRRPRRASVDVSRWRPSTSATSTEPRPRAHDPRAHEPTNDWPLSYELLIQREERLEAAQDPLPLGFLALLLGARVEALARGDQLDPAAGELARQLGHDLGSAEQHGLERVLAEPEAIDLGRRDHVGAARLAGHQAH